jgi:hypothetical protein
MRSTLPNVAIVRQIAQIDDPPRTWETSAEMVQSRAFHSAKEQFARSLVRPDGTQKSRLWSNEQLCNLRWIHRFRQTTTQIDRHRTITNLRGVLPMQPNDPATLSPEQRAQEIARLLAAGVRRLFSQRTCDVPATLVEPEKSPESADTGLEVQRETRLTVHSG